MLQPPPRNAKTACSIRPSRKAFRRAILFRRRMKQAWNRCCSRKTRARELWKSRLRKARPSLIALGSAAVIALIAVYVLRDRRSVLSEWRDYIPWKH